MNELKLRITNELQQDFNVKIMDSMYWSLPVHLIQIDYQTVKRTKMDILLKMMLIAFNKAEIETAEELSDILLVEQLFINDLIAKMTRMGLIAKKGSSFVLTDSGILQLETGILVYEPEGGSKQTLYSPVHKSFFHGEIKNIIYDEKETYRYKNDFDDESVTSLDETIVLGALKTMGAELNEGNVQIVISEILSISKIKTDLVPCIEYHLYNSNEDLLYARVWNTLSEHWDETLETQLNEKERKKWRELYL